MSQQEEFSMVARKRSWVPEWLFAMFKWVIVYQPFRWIFTVEAAEEKLRG